MTASESVTQTVEQTGTIPLKCSRGTVMSAGTVLSAGTVPVLSADFLNQQHGTVSLISPVRGLRIHCPSTLRKSPVERHGTGS